MTGCSAPVSTPPPAISTTADPVASTHVFPTAPSAGAPISSVGEPSAAGPVTPTQLAAALPADTSAADSSPAALSAPAPPSDPTEPAAAPTPTSPGDTGFVSTISDIDPEIAARMSTSWHAGCPVPLSALRYVTVTYRGFDGSDHPGELVVASSVATEVAAIFGELYTAGYPIASLRLVDDFGGSDDDSMAANNSSAFNCRPVTGGGGFSEHSYGTAIDLNPVQNPYLSGSLVLPEQGRSYVDRHRAPGVIEPGDVVVTAFAGRGWAWGGSWTGPVDDQHFSVSGR